MSASGPDRRQGRPAARDWAGRAARAEAGRRAEAGDAALQCVLAAADGGRLCGVGVDCVSGLRCRDSHSASAVCAQQLSCLALRRGCCAMDRRATCSSAACLLLVVRGSTRAQS